MTHRAESVMAAVVTKVTNLNATGANVYRAAAGVAGKVNRLKVVDTYKYTGGENPPDKTFVGQLTGANNDAHWASNGHYLQGRQFGEAILSLLK